MKIEGRKDINALPISERERSLLKALLIDVGEINRLCGNANIYIDWQDFHNDYSPERTDPCPDYYGMYQIRRGYNDTIGDFMTIDDLDFVLCALCDFIEQAL